MTDTTRQYSGIIHDLSNDEYRQAPGVSATLLKTIVSKSVKHALTPRKLTASLDTGLKTHMLLLERETFLSQYVQGPDPSEHSGALQTASELRAVIDGMNTLRLPKLKTTGSRDELLELIVADDPEHLANVTDTNSLSVSDIKKRIKFINSDPRRGLLSTSGSISDLTKRLRDNGHTGEIWPEIIATFAAEHPDKEVLPFDEYQKYFDMHTALIDHLRAGDEPIFKWLLYAFTTPGVLQTEVSMFGETGKCRLDCLFKAGNQWIAPDVKTTQDASDEGFARQSARYGYDIQAGHYTEVSAECDTPLAAFPFICIEPEPPYAVNIFLPDDEFMATGFKKREWARKKYAEYIDTGIAVAYSSKSKVLSLPVWATTGAWDNE